MLGYPPPKAQELHFQRLRGGKKKRDGLLVSAYIFHSRTDGLVLVRLTVISVTLSETTAPYISISSPQMPVKARISLLVV